ncbi:MAG: carboxypeptidase regulatory-like domain-containing protein [Myxococcota bacterium]
MANARMSTGQDRRLYWAGLLALLALGIAWIVWRTPTADPDAEADAEPVVTSIDAGGGEASGAIARVQGKVYVERLRPRPEPLVEVVLDSGGGVSAKWAEGRAPDDERAAPEPDGGTGGTPTEPEAPSGEGEPAGSGDAGAPAKDEPEHPEVDLEPPSGECRVIAWQSGTQVSEPTPCAADGAFEVELNPGVHGRTAFEILVPGHLRAVLEVDVPEGGVGRLPPVALGQAETIEGQVVNSAGEPMPGVVVEAMPQPNLGEPEPWRATSDAQGQFAFRTLPPGPVTVQAEAPAHAPTVVEAIAPQSGLLLTLQSLLELGGRVAGPAEVLARAHVRIEGSGIWPAAEHPVQADGRFTIPAVPEGIYALEAVVEAEMPGEPEFASIPLENVAPPLTLTLALVPAHRVPVEVRDPSGNPVAGARVVLSNSSVGLLPKFALTDEAGQVDVGPVVPGPYVVRAHAEGFLSASPIAVTVDGSALPRQVLTLAQPGRIAGQVVDQDGHPVADARVELWAEHLFTAGESGTRERMAKVALQAAGSLGVTTGPVPAVPVGDASVSDDSPSTRTDRDGRFSFAMLTPGRYRLEASHGRFARSEETTVKLGAGRTRSDLRLVLRTGHRLTGRVFDGNDRPVEHATLRFGAGRSATTDDRGVFDGGIHRGRVRVIASARGLAPRELEVRIDDEPVDIEIVLGRARARLSGRIEGGNGEALANARVTLRTLDGLSSTRIEWTDDRGVYTFEELPPGAVELEVDHPDYGPRTTRLQLADEQADERIDLDLRKGWSIEVEVVAEGTGESLKGARVEGGGQRVRTDADGQATLTQLVEDEVTVVVHAVGYGERRLSLSRDDGDRQGRRVVLSEGGGVRGRVTDYRGDPVPGVEVVVRDLEGTVLGRARTDGRGRFDVSGLPATDVEVAAQPPPEREDELAPTAQNTDVLRGHVTKGVDLRFDRR